MLFTIWAIFFIIQFSFALDIYLNENGVDNAACLVGRGVCKTIGYLANHSTAIKNSTIHINTSLVELDNLEVFDGMDAVTIVGLGMGKTRIICQNTPVTPIGQLEWESTFTTAITLSFVTSLWQDVGQCLNI